MITRLEVDGVPAVLSPTTGPMHAGLVFRVGVADEPLPRRGVTRLVEHLVLDGPGATGRQHQPMTGAEHTFFHVRGDADEITTFLTGVCDALREPPVDRLEQVRDRLREHREQGDPLALWRHGARDFGAAGYPEWGLDGLTAEQLRDWIARYFTRENAALWVAGEQIPAGLKLHLPPGERRPAPVPSSALPITPAWFEGSGDELAWDAVVTRAPRAAVFANVLERHMVRELRQRDAVSGPVRTDYQPRAGGTARIVAHAEALPGRREAALGSLADVLAAMRVGRIDPADVATVVRLTADGLAEADTRGGRLPGQAFNLLAGRELKDLDEAVAEVRAVTPEQVAEVAAAAYGNGLLMTPAGTGAGWAGYTAGPTRSESAVTGRVHRAVNDPRHHLVAGAGGLSHVAGGTAATVRYDECAAMLVWPDGARHLIGPDAITVRVEPSLLRAGTRLTREADAQVPADRWITMPVREQIPQPPPRQRRPLREVLRFPRRRQP
ncbi:peptidase M16 [Actinoplanes sp. SE50]|uniref:insulinase family protein n=1 Tax=unclassified Actinoplanes TaxID=2626549 RepID=UPI00023EBC9D|nr:MULTISPECIES: insulinase family protein [unclassified Actinoplanes]AEV81760.1 peptidase M16 domain protein [Actinoplanes sp. SE50/110]ATO80161.1 peptidase M16 [Actinoplanes sp. SE50]SLL97565.1 peptidase M16 [Actinoplanes sp. SE50/110]